MLWWIHKIRYRDLLEEGMDALLTDQVQESYRSSGFPDV